MTKPNRQYEVTLDIHAPPDAVWKALSDATEIARWFAPTTSVEPRVGGRIVWQWAGLHTWDQIIEVFEPGRRLRTRYDSQVVDEAGGKKPLFVDFQIQGKGGTTTLRLVHSGFGPESDFDAEFDGIRSGWPVELRSLRLYLEQHRGKERLLAWSTCSTSLQPDSAWQRLTGAGGLAAAALPSLREGEPFAVEVATAGSISGTALFVPSPREFSGIAKNIGNGWFRIHCEHWAGATQIWLWLSVYDGSRQQVARFQTGFDALLQRLFGKPVHAERLA